MARSLPIFGLLPNKLGLLRVLHRVKANDIAVSAAVVEILLPRGLDSRAVAQHPALARVHAALLATRH